MKKQAWSQALVTASLMGLTACGSSSSLNQYDTLRDSAIPIAQSRAENAVPATAAAVQDISRITVDSGNINWVEGRSETLVGTASLMVGSTRFDLVATDLPSWLQLSKSWDGSKINWQVSGAPPMGFTSGDDKKTVTFYLQIKTIGSVDKDIQSMIAASPSQLKAKINFDVNRTGSHPLVSMVGGLNLDQSDVVQEGTIRPFTVEVGDVGSLGGAAPEIDIQTNIKTKDDALKINGRDFVAVDAAHPAPEKISDGKWRFYFVLNLKDKSVPRPKNKANNNYDDEAFMTFAIHVVSASKLDSTHPVTFNVKFDTAKQAPKIALADKADPTFTMGSTNTLDFIITSDLSGTALSVDTKAMSDALKTLGDGKGKFKCAKQVAQKVSCRLQWTPTCNDKVVESTQKLTLSATNKTGSISAPASFSQELKLVKPEGGCPLPTKKAATKSDKTSSNLNSSSGSNNNVPAASSSSLGGKS